MNATTHDDHPMKRDLLDRIACSERGKCSLKIKSLLTSFGYAASQRVRQSSLSEVLEKLREWDIESRFPGGMTANEYVTLSRRDPTAPAPSTAPTAPSLDDSPLRLDASPLERFFRAGDAFDDHGSRTICRDLVSAIWSFRPVCVFLEATDECFALALGFFGAIMRRRARMFRSGQSDYVPLAPEVLTTERIKRHLGRQDGGSIEPFPLAGEVYVLRDDPNDVDDDDLVATLREGFVPHTVRLKGLLGAEPIERRRMLDEGSFAELTNWLRAFSGSMQLPVAAWPSADTIDVASLFADAGHIQDSLMDRATLRVTDPKLRSGFESTEHVVLKNSLIKELRRRFPTADVLVEEYVDRNEPEGADAPDRLRRDKPDLRVAGKLWVEVETLRSLSLAGSSPFFELEGKLRRKLDGMRQESEFWLMVPSDVAVLGCEQLGAIANNLRAAYPALTIRFGFVDLAADRPIFLDYAEQARAELKLVGASWRQPKPPPESKRLLWKDVAGYSNLKEKLKAAVLDPMIHPEKYAGIEGCNGLLLYGLPGCGKSLIGRVLAGEGDIACRLLVPSDFTSMWLGEGVMKIRAIFDWALKQPACLLVIDEIDAIAQQRSEHNMHSNDKREVNELLAQLDRIADKPIAVVGTTNYMRGIDVAVRRSGRFSVKIPVFPPTEADRCAIFDYYVHAERKCSIDGLSGIDVAHLGANSALFTPSDIKAVVGLAIRDAIYRTKDGSVARLATEDVTDVVKQYPRSIPLETATDWLKEARQELGSNEPQLDWLEDEIGRASGRSN